MTAFPYDAPPPGFHLYFEDGRWCYALNAKHRPTLEHHQRQGRLPDPILFRGARFGKDVATDRAWRCYIAWRDGLGLAIVERTAPVATDPRTEADAAWEAKGDSDKYAEGLLVTIANLEIHVRELERQIRAMEDDDAVLESFRGTVGDLKEQLGLARQQRKDSGAHLIRVRDALHKSLALIKHAKTLVVTTPLQSGVDMGLWFAGILEEAEKLTERQSRENEEVRKSDESSSL